MLRYQAGYKYVATGVHAQVLDFPAAISWGTDLDAARRALAGALVDLAEFALQTGQSIPIPNPTATNPEMDLEEPIYLVFEASSQVREVPVGIVT